MKKYFVFLTALFLLMASCQETGQKAGYKSGNYADGKAGDTYVAPNPYAVGDFSDTALRRNEVRNIILLIGDGMGVPHVQAAQTANRGRLYLDHFDVVGLMGTQSASDYITDSGAAGTALACGKKTRNHAIGVGPDSVPMPSILELAEAQGLATGLVATAKITHATPAAFIAHNPDRNDYEGIARDFLRTDVDFFAGGGKDNFNKRGDGQNLLDSLAAKGYTLTGGLEAMQAATGKVAAFFAGGHPGPYQERGEMLVAATEKALALLSQNEKGFFLMVEGSQIDWGGHDNSTAYVVSEMHDFDRAVGQALKFASKHPNTLVIATSDHETGGFAVIDGDQEKGSVTGRFATGNHSGEKVPVFAFGAQAQRFGGMYENTGLYDRMRRVFGF